MSIIGQRNIFCTIDRNGELVYAKAIILSKDFEASAWLAVGVSDYLIREADWEISKAPSQIPLGKGVATDAIGVKANTGIGSALIHLTEANGGVLIKSLIFECVKGLMQAFHFSAVTMQGFRDSTLSDTRSERIGSLPQHSSP